MEQFITVSPVFMLVFFSFVVVALAVDFMVLKKKGEANVPIKDAAIWSIIWVVVAVIFNMWIWFGFNEIHGPDIANTKATEFFIAFLVEKSLSIDNLFLFLIIFSALGLKGETQNKVLLIGIGGAIVLRTIMIFIGMWLINEFSWILYVFGLILLVTGIKMLKDGLQKTGASENHTPKILTWVSKFIPLSSAPSDKFWVRENGKFLFTTVFLASITIAFVDVVFAVDSIPAVVAISKDPFIVLTSNIMALLGLRALFFVLAELKDRFWALGIGLGFVLMYIGMKMLIIDIIHINAFVSLLVIILIISLSIVYSLMNPKKKLVE